MPVHHGFDGGAVEWLAVGLAELPRKISPTFRLVTRADRGQLARDPLKALALTGLGAPAGRSRLVSANAVGRSSARDLRPSHFPLTSGCARAPYAASQPGGPSHTQQRIKHLAHHLASPQALAPSTRGRSGWYRSYAVGGDPLEQAMKPGLDLD